VRLAALLALLPSLAFGALPSVNGVASPASVNSVTDGTVSGVAGAAGTCTPEVSPSIAYSESNADSSSGFASPNAIGQSFATSIGQQVAKVRLYVYSADTNRTTELRVGESSDLSAGYKTANASAGGSVAWVEWDFTAEPFVATGTTSYLGAMPTGGTVQFGRDNSASAYSGGQYLAASAGWTLGGGIATRDIIFEVYLCQ
jgi:hypothetical protein